MMNCPDCKSEMSKKWQPKSADDPASGSGLVWLCGVCGRQLTQADIKSYQQAKHKVEHETAGVLPFASTLPAGSLK